MTEPQIYDPGPANLARAVKDGEQKWTLVLVREMRHSPEKEASDSATGSAGTIAPARTVLANPSRSRAPMRCAAMIDVPVIKPKMANSTAVNIALAAVAPASATAPRLPIAMVSTTPRT